MIQAAAAPSAMRRPDWPRSSSRAAPLPMAAIPISTSCSRSRPANSTRRSGPRSSPEMQQLVFAKAIYAPIWQLGFFNGIGPRVGQSSFGAIAGFAYTAPFEDMTIKAAVMKRFVVRRAGYALLSLFLLSLTIFLFVRVTGDPAALLVEPGASEATSPPSTTSSASTARSGCNTRCSCASPAPRRSRTILLLPDAGHGDSTCRGCPIR